MNYLISFLTGFLPSVAIGLLFLKFDVEIPAPAGWVGTIGAVGVLAGYQVARMMVK